MKYRSTITLIVLSLVILSIFTSSCGMRRALTLPPRDQVETQKENK